MKQTRPMTATGSDSASQDRRPYRIEVQMAQRLSQRSGLSVDEALARLRAAGAASEQTKSKTAQQSKDPGANISGTNPSVKTPPVKTLPAPQQDDELPPMGFADATPIIDAIDRLEKKFDRFLKIDHTELEKIQIEVADISGRIRTTKAEIAALRHPLAKEDRLQEASQQLSAVVAATEEATDNIMNNAEMIEEVIAELKSHGLDEYQARRLQDIGDLVVGIFEACNFQDLTGQRISKVVDALNFIEDRVYAMMAAWNEKEFETMPMPEGLHRKDGHLDLHGPSKAEEVDSMDQNAIDALFG